MSEAKWERFGWGVGLGFAVLSVAGAQMTGAPPKPTESAADISKFFVDGGSTLRWGSFVGLLAFLLLAWWGASAGRSLQRATGSIRLTVTTALGIAIATIGAAVNLVLVSSIGIAGIAGAGGASEVKFFYLVSTCALGVAFMGFALIAWSLASATFRFGVMPRTVGVLAAAVAVVSIVASAAVATTDSTIFQLGFVAVITFVVLVVVASIVMLRRPVPETADA